MSRKKIVEQEILITDFEFPNFGTGVFNDNIVKIKNTIPGQKILAKIVKRRRFYEGSVIEKIKNSNLEIKSKCEDFLICGGCTFQNISYDDEILIKKNMIEKILIKEKIQFEKIEIFKALNTGEYRNKMEFSFGDLSLGGELALGMRKINSFYEVVTSNNCNIIDDDFKKILLETLDFFKNTNEEFYHKGKKTGSLRHLIIRKGKFSREIFVNLVTTSVIKTDLSKWMYKINGLSLDGKIVGIGNTLNDSIGDVVKKDNFILLYGQDYFSENLLGLNFKISPFSFFQTNSEGAEELYKTVKEFTGELKDKIIFDLYSGTGTIGQIISKDAKKVIGIEIVEEAVEAAKNNARLNNIDNCEFICGDVLTKVNDLNISPDIIILDPPRDGIHTKAIEKIIAFNTNEIIYISCKPTSLARDLKIFLLNGYVIKKIRCHDLFPRTYHVETVVLLELLN